jgi:hypothetical protein
MYWNMWTRREVFSGAAGAFISSRANAQSRRLLLRIDATAEYPPDQFMSHGATRVVQSPAGRYREAAPTPSARFGYRFKIEHAGRPHLAVIRYPDDKRRYMCVMDGTSYDLSTGVFTGHAQPLTGRMLEIHQVFWPRWQDASITFLTWGKDEPAAIAGFDIYELDELAEAPRPAGADPGAGRELGIQYEDPCGTAASEGAMSRQEWMDHLVAMMCHTGQSLLVYPVVWYHGPQYPSNREPSDAFDMVVAPDRRQYSRWTSHPVDWYARLLDRFGREGLQFQASMTMLRLGSLMRGMNADLDSIRKGSPTINNMLWNDQVQAGTQDWTPIYNVHNYPKALEYHARKASFKDFPYAYGEKTGQPYHGGPIFNPLHADVQKAVIGTVGEIAARYARYPAFKGVSFNMWHATIVWFASLHAGYDDYTMALFEKETGVKVRVKPEQPDRFSRRYQFLMHTARPLWIAWRCRKLHEFHRRIRDAVVAARPDLRVTFTMWNETTVPALHGSLSAAHQLHARLNTGSLWREGGFDPALYANEPNIEVDLTLDPGRDRGWDTEGAQAPVERSCMFRDHDFLDDKTLGAMRYMQRPGAFIFNCWVEAWGEHKWFPCEPNDAQAKQLAVMDGAPAEGIFRLNSIYPNDGFWWDSQLRITHAFQGGAHFLEHYAHAVAEFDACRITRGGLFLDKAHCVEIRNFALAYRALPREKFSTVGSSTDPVAVRTLIYGGRRYLYLVNREYYPVQVSVAFDRPARLFDLGSKASIDAGREWVVTLDAYQLRSFTLAPDIAVSGFRATPPDDVAASISADARKALADLDAASARGWFIPGAVQMRRNIANALAEGHLAYVRRAVNSYAVRKARQ